MSAQAAMTELRTIKPNENRAIPVTEPPNQSTSPYAIMMVVKFLNMVYTGIVKNCRALLPVYIMLTSRSDIGNPMVARQSILSRLSSGVVYISWLRLN